MFISTGRLIYDPPRPGMKRNTKWWLVVRTDQGIVEYYADQVRRNPLAFGETRIDLKSPSWGSHISVIRGEKPRRNINMWRRYHNELLEFEYSHYVRRGGDTSPDGNDLFWFVDVFCPRLHEIRKELGLPVARYDGKPYTYHITVGRVY